MNSLYDSFDLFSSFHTFCLCYCYTLGSRLYILTSQLGVLGSGTILTMEPNSDLLQPVHWLFETTGCKNIPAPRTGHQSITGLTDIHSELLVYLINLTCTALHDGRKLEYLTRTRTDARRACNLHT